MIVPAAQRLFNLIARSPMKKLTARNRWSITLLCRGICLLGMAATAQADPPAARKYWGLAERLEKSKSAVLVKYLESADRKKDDIGSTTYRVLRVLKDPRQGLIAGKILVVPGALQAEFGESSLLLEYDANDPQVDELVWTEGFPVSEACLQYISHAPPRKALPNRRMEYHFRFLGNADKQIADDAYWVFRQEFGNEIIPFAKKLPPEKVRRLVFEGRATARTEQLDLFAMLLGWCGTEADAERLEEMIRMPPKSADESRLELRGILVAYLLLKKGEGLKVVEELLTRSQGTSSAAIGSKLAAMEALKFMFNLGEGRIPSARLCETLRQAMKHSDIEDLAIETFTEWKFWEMQPELVQRFGEATAQRSVKSAIIKYYWASTRDVPPAQAKNPPAHALRGRDYLEKLRNQDPKLVSFWEKIFLRDERQDAESRRRGERPQERQVEEKSN